MLLFVLWWRRLLLESVFKLANCFSRTTIENPLFCCWRLKIDPFGFDEQIFFGYPIEKEFRKENRLLGSTRLLGQDGDGVFLSGEGFRNPITSFFIFRSEERSPEHFSSDHRRGNFNLTKNSIPSQFLNRA